MFEVRNGIIFYIRQTKSGFDVFRTFDNKYLECIAQNLPTLKEVYQVIDEEV